MSVELQFNLLIDPTWNDINQVPPKFPMMTNDAYVMAVREDIQGIMNNKVGFEVLNRLKKWNRVVRITPVRGDQGVCVSPSAEFGENRDLIWNRQISPFLNKMLGMQTRPIWAVVFYTPGAFNPGGTCHNFYKSDKRSNYMPNRQEVLVHELVHAIRTMSRTINPDSVKVHKTNLQGFDSIEEFIAILVQNMFQSIDKGKLRADHQGFRELDPNLANSFEFFKISTRSFAAVEAFVKQNKYFTANLAKLDVPFNPVRAFFKDPRKCREFSASDAAFGRDTGPLAVLFRTLTPGIPIESWHDLLHP